MFDRIESIIGYPNLEPMHRSNALFSFSDFQILSIEMPQSVQEAQEST